MNILMVIMEQDRLQQLVEVINPGGSVAAEEDTSVEQTINIATAGSMTVPEVQKGFSSTLSADVWFWNQYNNTLKICINVIIKISIIKCPIFFDGI